LKKLDIETPAIVVDLDTMEKNIKTMTDYAKSHNIRLRPHFKTIKTPAIAWKEIRSGAIGVCCQKLGEAEVCAMSGIDDIHVTNEIVESSKIMRLVNLTRHVKSLKVNVDNPINVEALSEAAKRKNSELGVIIELNMYDPPRAGVPPGSNEVVSLAKQISSSPGLVFKGIQGYGGWLNRIEPIAKKKTECEKLDDKILQTKKMIEDIDIKVEVVAGAGTGSYKFESAITELQCGSFPLMDWTYNSWAPEFPISMSILTTATSVWHDRVITDAGDKTISTDHGQPKVKGRSDLEYRTRGDEHGLITSKDRNGIDLKLGDKVEVYSAHVCTTVNLHDRIYGIRDDEVEAVWPILARGRSQ
jgi:D-serine deaminase-like pyridoxal phosphate-dependent protein